MPEKQVKRFHQMVRLVKGPVNTTVIDLQSGHIYHLENFGIEALEDKQYDEIPELIEALEAEKLVIDVPENTWIPALDLDANDIPDLYRLEIEEGADVDLIREVFRDEQISGVFFYGTGPLPEIIPGIGTIRKKKDFDPCIQRSTPQMNKRKASRSFYQFNRHFNSCWGKAIAVTEDNNVRPCIHSTIITGHLTPVNFNTIMEKAREYWAINKDKVERCRICEFRYTCADCRELAYRETGDIFAANPKCSYDPFTPSS